LVRRFDCVFFFLSFRYLHLFGGFFSGHRRLDGPSRRRRLLYQAAISRNKTAPAQIGEPNGPLLAGNAHSRQLRLAGDPP
jgi:hypothetical protein